MDKQSDKLFEEILTRALLLCEYNPDLGVDLLMVLFPDEDRAAQYCPTEYLAAKDMEVIELDGKENTEHKQ